MRPLFAPLLATRNQRRLIPTWLAKCTTFATSLLLLGSRGNLRPSSMVPKFPISMLTHSIWVQSTIHRRAVAVWCIMRFYRWRVLQVIIVCLARKYSPVPTAKAPQGSDWISAGHRLIPSHRSPLLPRGWGNHNIKQVQSRPVPRPLQCPSLVMSVAFPWFAWYFCSSAFWTLGFAGCFYSWWCTTRCTQ